MHRFKNSCSGRYISLITSMLPWSSYIPYASVHYPSCTDSWFRETMHRSILLHALIQVTRFWKYTIDEPFAKKIFYKNLFANFCLLQININLPNFYITQNNGKTYCIYTYYIIPHMNKKVLNNKWIISFWNLLIQFGLGNWPFTIKILGTQGYSHGRCFCLMRHGEKPGFCKLRILCNE
jgi:hypothetical protein